MHTARGAMLWMLATCRSKKNDEASKLKVVLAYSGGLDTSIILKWLQTEYDAEVVTFTADLGQGEEVEPARRKAEMLGVKPENIFIEDLREEFVRDFVFPMFRANTLYEGRLSARHVDRPAADRQAPDRDRAAGRRGRGLSRRDRQGQRPGPLRARLLCAGARHQGDRAVARMGVREPRGAARLRREAPDPDRQGQARRGALLDRRQPAALVVRREGARGPGRRGAGICPPAHDLARGRAGQGDDHHHRFRARRSGRDRRREAVAGGAADASSTSSATTMASAASTWSRTASSG